MAKFTIDEEKIIDALDTALEIWADELSNRARKYVPRDWSRPPKPLPFKWIRKSTPYRKQGVTSRWWKWYLQVTGNLSRSIWFEKLKRLNYVVGVQKWPTEKYAAVQEFGNPSKKIPARPYLGKALQKDKEDIIELVKNIFNQWLK